MGMAASQARYLGLTARKTNCEWEGQQINQARTALANQSANYFNQLLALEVPDCPDKTDFTKVQYSYTDGFNNSVLDNWRQLSDSNKEYNYIVDHYYFADIYTGSKKLMSDPQVTTKNDTIKQAIAVKSNALVEYDPDENSYFSPSNNQTYYDLSDFKYDAELQNAILDLAARGYIKTNEFGEVDTQTLNSLRGYHDGSSWHLATVGQLEASTQASILNNGYVDFTALNIPANSDAIAVLNNEYHMAEIEKMLQAAGSTATAEDWVANNYQAGQSVYNITGAAATIEDAYSAPAFDDMITEFTPTQVGNQILTELGSLTPQDETALAQIIKDCRDSSIADYITLNPDGSIEYSGAGIYKFDWNGDTRYATHEDLVNCMQRPLFDYKPIDAQVKLATFGATYVKQEVKETNYALLETDGTGRFKTVKFDDDSTTYTLNCEQITDEDAYNDAMNSYYHDVAEYEKMIADINAKTEVIQQQDRTLELRLKQLDTEQLALQTEMEAVKKVIQKNVEMTFKTFGG